MAEFQKRQTKDDCDDLDDLLLRAEETFDEEGGIIDETQYHNEDLMKRRNTYDPKLKQLIFEEVLARYYYSNMTTKSITVCLGILLY